MLRYALRRALRIVGMPLLTRDVNIHYIFTTTMQSTPVKPRHRQLPCLPPLQLPESRQNICQYVSPKLYRCQGGMPLRWIGTTTQYLCQLRKSCITDECRAFLSDAEQMSLTDS